MKREDSCLYPVKGYCGKCPSCLAFKARQWAVRCTHEMLQHKASSFLTLTYSKKHLPEGGTLIKADLQKFIKRLRFNNPEIKFKHYSIGEYGGKLGRPHYHLILFGLEFQDQTFWKKTKTGNILYRSKNLEKSWKLGHSYIGKVTLKSIKYVAGYTYKQVLGKKADAHYQGKLPEFNNMSKQPAISLEYYKANKHQIFEKGTVQLEDKHISIPQYYRDLYQEEFPELFHAYRQARRKAYTISRLQLKE